MAEGWHVTSQRKTTEITSGGRFQDVMEIHFATDSGTDGYVRIPTAKFTPDHVREAIDAQVAVIDAVHKL
jgi:hypothetical protein